MAQKIQQEINTFKQRNGNITFTTKELIKAIYTKLDRHERDIAYNKASNAILMIVILGICLKLFVFT